MKYDELSFLNHQLAGMLKSGIPLEGALRQLASTMRKGTLRSELEHLEEDLAKGTPMPEALRSRRLPDLYVRLLGIGARGNDLPSMLNLLGDHYTRLGSLWARLQGLMVYPAIVLVAATAVSLVISWLINTLVTTQLNAIGASLSGVGIVVIWILPLSLAAMSVAFLAVFSVPSWRKLLNWRLPGFREAGLAQLASTLAILMRGGSSFRDSIELLSELENPGPLRHELERWKSRLADGRVKFDEIVRGSRIIPPLFIWLVSGSGEDWAEGFGHAAEIYQARVTYRVDMMLYAALPVMTLFLGGVMIAQAAFVLQVFKKLLYWL